MKLPATPLPSKVRLQKEKGLLRDHHLDTLEHYLDRRFAIPGMPFRFGFDGIVGIIPVVGDVFGAGMTLLFVVDAWLKGARKRVVARMFANLFVDMSLGAVPIVGDLFDFGFKANTRNLALLRREQERLGLTSGRNEDIG